MRWPWSSRPDMRQMFETRSHAWAQVGLASQLTQRAARRAKRQVLIFLPTLIGILIVYSHRNQVFGRGNDTPVRVVTVVALVILGWAVARDIGRALGPALFRRLDPATAGTVGFLIRLLTIGLAILIAARIAGLEARTIAVGGAFTAVVFGLAAQQTLGNLIAGTVLLSARPFRVGERVRFQGGPLAGEVEGVVSSLGLLYTTLSDGDESTMVPNSVVLSVAINPLREPDSVNLRARLTSDVKPSDLQALLDRGVSTPTRYTPHIALEEVDGDEVVVRIAATPADPREGPKLADEILTAVANATRDGAPGTPVAPASTPAGDG